MMTDFIGLLLIATGSLLGGFIIGMEVRHRQNIAATAALLQACKQTVGMFEIMKLGFIDGDTMQDPLNVASARKAIAKAEGKEIPE